VVVLVSFALVLGKARNLSHEFAMAILAGLLLSPHTYLQDYSLIAIVALAVPYAVIRYVLLIPWPYFWSSRDALPFAIVGLVTVAALAVSCILKRDPQEGSFAMQAGDGGHNRAPEIVASPTQFREAGG
jgi:fatty acid desaturase